MSYENLLVEKKDRIGRITINRPKKLNALDIETVIELSRAFADMKDDAEVGVVVLTRSSTCWPARNSRHGDRRSAR
jgi:enoyl-CoA hydratase/carnithine racemase